MTRDSTARRLKKLMEERNLRQVDILNLCQPICAEYGMKMNKSDISQYCSGKNEPLQDKIFILAKALNVSEAYLMGFDVPADRMPSDDAERFNAFAANFNEHRNNKIISLNLSDEELDLINKYRSLNASEKDIVMTVLDKVHAGHKEESEDAILTLTVEDLRQMPLPLRMKFESYVDGDKLNLVARKRKK